MADPDKVVDVVVHSNAAAQKFMQWFFRTVGVAALAGVVYLLNLPSVLDAQARDVAATKTAQAGGEARAEKRAAAVDGQLEKIVEKQQAQSEAVARLEARVTALKESIDGLVQALRRR